MEASAFGVVRTAGVAISGRLPIVFLLFAGTKMLFVVSLLAMVSGCASVTESNRLLSQQAAADYVLNFQSWKAIKFIKPDIAGTVTGLAVRSETFTGGALIKLLNKMKRPRRFIVVVLDRRHSPDPAEVEGGIDHIQKFFEHLSFSGWLSRTDQHGTTPPATRF